MLFRFTSFVLCCATLSISILGAQTREEKVRADKKKVEAEGFWIYNDLAKGMAEAKRTGKPMLVNLRCIPCEECVKLDDELVDQDPVIRPLLEKFVCIRIVGTNGLDLATFQYDTDQSFAIFLMNADGTVYGRFGTRSHRTEWYGDVSLPGMAKALEGALLLHAQYPANRESLAAKRGPKPDFASPEQYPSLKEKYTSKLDYEGNVVKSCIHCHQIGDAQREYYRSQKQPIPETLFYPYPHPKSIGLILDPQERARVKEVVTGSWGAKAGLQPGDDLLALDGQPLLSIADVQWVLHQTPAEGATLIADVRRGGRTAKLKIELPEQWRRASDISWRVSSWTMRRMGLGGMILEPITDAERSAAGVPQGSMALRAKHVGEYGLHAAAKNAGFRKGDIVIEFDGRNDWKSESDLLFHALTNRKPGEQVSVSVLREGKRIDAKIPMQM